MGDMPENKHKKPVSRRSKCITIALLAHVDAGKTTLSEALLYLSGAIKDMGRVDHQNTFLDTAGLERERGITIFSSQAQMVYGDIAVTLLDTPGHVDFSAEMERTLQVIDYAVLVISGADGVQGHTETLWGLLDKYRIPCFLFVNKMDLPGTEKGRIMEELQKVLSDGCVDFTGKDQKEFVESIAVCDEGLMEIYLENGKLDLGREIPVQIRERKIFPCFFGSALKLEGVEEFLNGLEKYTVEKEWEKEFGARVFKVSRDPQGTRLTHMRVTGGELRVKMPLTPDEKVNQIRIYSGEKYETTDVVNSGDVCCVTGLDGTYPGQGLGVETDFSGEQLEPVLRYGVLFPEGTETTDALKKMRQLEEEDPKLHLFWDERMQQLFIQPMGEVQLEVLQSIVKERFGMEIQFGEGAILYRETIRDMVEGVGHFEPLRHYAEVHLLMEPGEAGSGMIFGTSCSEDVLDGNWQRLILTHLGEKEHRGVLTGSPLTDMRITLAAGRAHLKHTEGGDFREATYRAVRQGLMQAKSVLLEPYYDFTLEVPEQSLGRAMADMERLAGSFSHPVMQDGTAVFSGKAPAALLQSYQKEVAAYTRGQGGLSLSFGGYRPCRDSEEVIGRIDYDPERDAQNPADSVFCSHGAGIVVKWDRVKEHMHLESILAKDTRTEGTAGNTEMIRAVEECIGEEEIERIFARTFFANKSDKTISRKKFAPARRENISGNTGISAGGRKPEAPRENYLLVDGYNIIFSWDELRELAGNNIDGARGRLLDIMCDYQGIKGCSVIVVFDAYRVKGHTTEIMDYHNIHVVYTKEAETADQYIEKFAHDNSHKYKVTVATSDGLEQIIIRGQGCLLLSARELFNEVSELKRELREKYMETGTAGGISLARLKDKMPELPEG